MKTEVTKRTGACRLVWPIQSSFFCRAISSFTTRCHRLLVLQAVACLMFDPPPLLEKKTAAQSTQHDFPNPKEVTTQLLLRYLTMVSRNIRKEKINFLHTNVSQSKKEKKADLYCVGCYGNFHNNHNNKINNCNIKRRMYYIVFICYSPLKENEHFFSLNPRSETVMKC